MSIADTGLYYNPLGKTLAEQWSGTRKPGYVNAEFSGQDDASGVPLFRYQGGTGLVQGYPYGNGGTAAATDTEQPALEISIPENAYPWSKSHTGLPDWALAPLQELAPRLPGLVSGLEDSLGRLDNLPGLVDDWARQESQAYLERMPGLDEQLRKPLEGLAARGVWDGTMSRDAGVGLGRALADDFRDHQSELAAQALGAKAQGLTDSAQLRASAAGLVGELVGLARSSDSSSEDRLSRYTSLLSLLL